MKKLIFKKIIVKISCLVLFGMSPFLYAGAQRHERLTIEELTILKSNLSINKGSFSVVFADPTQATAWIETMSLRLKPHIKDEFTRLQFLKEVHYQATRAGLDPQLVLGLIQVESGFKKYVISVAGARGYMQVMPFWIKEIGTPKDNLFDLSTNLRYGCAILRFYLNKERGNLFRALGRYNGSLGKAAYPSSVLGSWRKFWYYTDQKIN